MGSPTGSRGITAPHTTTRLASGAVMLSSAIDVAAFFVTVADLVGWLYLECWRRRYGI